MKVLPYSYSSLTSFEGCAFKHYKIKVSKEVKDLPYAQAEFGIKVHSGAELYIKESKPYDGPFAQRITEVVDHYRAKPDVTLHAELQLCVDRQQQPVEWFSPTAHARGVLDLVVRGPDWTHLADWKTGKPNLYTTQLKHNAMLEMFHRPEVQKVTWNYEWLKGGTKTSGVLHREFVQQEWLKYEQRVIKLELALERTQKGDQIDIVWPKNPSGLCKAYCAVTECQYNGNYVNVQPKA